MTARPAPVWTRSAGQLELRAGSPGDGASVRGDALGMIVEEIER